MKRDAELEAKQDAWVARQLENAPPLTFEAQELIKRLMGPKSAAARAVIEQHGKPSVPA